MIKRSAGLAASAVCLSLALHFLGVGLTVSPDALQPRSDPPTKTVAAGSSFDEIADLMIEPVEPQPTEQVEPPEPEEQPPVQPREAEAPTTEVLVASPNPKQTFAPDTGFSQPVSEEVNGSGPSERAEASEPDLPEPSAGDQSGVADPAMVPPVEPAPDATSPPAASVEPPSEAPPAKQDATVGPDRESVLAPVTAPVTPSPQVTAPVDDIIAALPPETTPSAVDELEPPAVAETQEPDTEQQGGAVTTSLRPPSTRPERPPEEQTAFSSAQPLDTLQSRPPTIESPLTLYSREGVDLFAGQQRESGTRGSGTTEGRGPGNSDVTNYPGQVLVHLNRKPPVVASARGWARVTFRINPDGSLASVDVIDGSGAPEIDRAAIAQVQRGVPFPQPPGGQSRMLTFVYRRN